MIRTLRCLLCNKEILMSDLVRHKEDHPNERHYGIMWPLCFRTAESEAVNFMPPVHESKVLAEIIGVKKVFILDEGRNISGSMKDYIVREAINLGLYEDCNAFTVVSSGNHAVSLAKFASAYHKKSVVFVPASSSKIPFLATFPSTLIIGLKDAIFEDTYVFANQVDLRGLYNANVSNDSLIVGFRPVAERIKELDPQPTHILSGVGNGCYLAGICWGMGRFGDNLPKIIPVGMKGAFPVEEAFRTGLSIIEYTEFLTDESAINAAEGSIATSSYSMPQLIHAIKLSGGFPLGGLTNNDLGKAYRALLEDKNLLNNGVIPEPTGIMGLAAALKHKDAFSRDSIILVSFTGHGVKDEAGIKKLVSPEISEVMIERAKKVRPDLITCQDSDTENKGKVVFVDKDTSPDEINAQIKGWIKGG
ncbi:MAG: PLP-dependent lyase/thiolase [Patescibacteria group bacterium]